MLTWKIWLWDLKQDDWVHLHSEETSWKCSDWIHAHHPDIANDRWAITLSVYPNWKPSRWRKVNRIL